MKTNSKQEVIIPVKHSNLTNFSVDIKPNKEKAIAFISDDSYFSCLQLRTGTIIYPSRVEIV